MGSQYSRIGHRVQSLTYLSLNCHFVNFSSRPPRLMGEGFVVMQSNDVDIYYYQDEPGKLMLAHIH